MKHTIVTRCIIALMLCVLLPINVARADESNNDYTKEIVALLEDPQYAGTITLLQDVDFQYLPNRYIMEIDGPKDQEKVLDLNGHMLSCKHMDNHGNLRVIDSTGDGVLVGSLRNYGILTVDGATIMDDESGPVVTNWWNGTFHFVSGNVCVNPEWFNCALKNAGGVCIIDGGTISGNIAILSGEGTELYGISGQDESGQWYGTTGTRWHDGTITINGGMIEGDIEAYDTDVTIAGGTVRGQIVMERRYEYKDGRPIKLETPQDMQYYNTDGDTVTLPSPTYELHEENGEMKRGYWDVSVDDWFYAPVQSLMDDGVLDYGEDGNFGPSELLTRGQAAALLARACGVETQEEWQGPVFYDVAETTPYAKYINAGKNAGLLSGNGQGKFHPEDTVTRQEFAVLVMNAVGKNYLGLPTETKSVTFSDEAAIAAWARDAVMEGAAHGLWQGVGNGNFAPQNTISRAEAATMVARLLR